MDKSQAWWPLAIYPAFFALGNSLAPHDLLRAAARRYGPAVLLGILATTVPLAFAKEPRGFSNIYVAYHLLKVYCSWFWILGLFYLAGRYLSGGQARRARLRRQRREAATLPQPVAAER